MKCLSSEPTYQLGPMAINTNTEGEEFPHFWYIYFQHCRHYWCASIMLTAPLKVQWRKACTTKGTITKGSRLMQLLSSLPGLVSLSSSSKSWCSLLWSLNPPLCDSSVAKLSANSFFYLFLFAETALSMLHQLMKHTWGSPDRQKCLNYVLHCKQWWSVQLSVRLRGGEIKTLHVSPHLTALKSFDEWEVGQRTAWV